MKKLLLLFAVMLSTVGAWAQTVVESNASVEKAYETTSWQQLENVPQDMVDANLVSGMTAADVVGIEEQVTVPQGYLWVQFAYGSGANRLETIGVDVLDSEGNVLDSDYHFGYTGTYQSNRDYNVFVGVAGTYKLRYWVTFKREANTSTGKITLKHVEGNIAHKKYYRIYTDAVADNYVHINAYNASSTGDRGTVILKAEEENADQFFSFVSTGEANKYYVKSLSGYYLKVTGWNYDANSSSKTAFTIEGTDAEGYTISQNEFTSGGNKTKAQTIDGVTYLFNNDATGNKWKLQEVDLNALTPVTVNYTLMYNGEEKANQSVETKVGMPYPEVTVELPYGIVANRPVGGIKTSEVVDGVVTKEIQLTTNLPFVAASEPGSITRWYYMKMHSNNRKYIQNINEEYLEWADGEMDLTSIDSYAWAFVGNPFDGFKMVNKASGLNKAVLSTGSGNPSMTAYADATAFVYSKTAENVPGGFCMKYPSSGQYLNAQSGKVAHWGSADAGSTFMVEDALPVQLTTDANPFYYALKSGRPGEFWYTYDSSDGKISLGANTGEDTQLWFFKGLYQDGKLCVQLYPKADPTKAMSYENTNDAAGKIVAQVPETEGWKNTWKFVNTNGAAPYGLRTPGDENYLSNNGGTNNKMGMWNASPADDKGTAIYIHQTIDNIITDMAGNTYESTSFAQVGQLLEPAFTGVAGYTLSNKCWIDNKFTADIDFGFPVSKDGGVTNATMIRQGSWTYSVMKWHAVDGVVKAQVNDALSTDVSEWLWAIYPKYNAGAFTFNIKNVATNSYVKANAEAEGAGNQVANSNVSLDAMGTDFTITKNGDYIKLNYKNTSDALLHLSVNSEKTADQFLGVYSGSHNGDNVSFLVPSYKATITDAKAATLYTPVAVTIPEGVTAKYVKAEGENMGSTGKLVYTKLENVIPANSAVVLTGEAGDYTFTATTEVDEEVADNVLFGYATQTAATDNTGIYALANKTNGVAFYPFAGSTYKAGKAYLNIAGLRTTSEVRLFNIFDEGEETGIESIETENAKAEIYDLAGRRVQKAQKGLYIVNGVKVIK